MINDLISRQAAIEIIQSIYPGMPRVPWMRKDWQKRYEPYIRTENAIRELPSVRPERSKGEWIDNETSYADGVRQTCTCSVCGIRSVRPLGDFCRWCGADMREDTDNKTTVCPMCFDCPDNCPFGADMRKENR